MFIIAQLNIHLFITINLIKKIKQTTIIVINKINKDMMNIQIKLKIKIKLNNINKIKL